ncbi:hypothetical protein GT037_007390 [Alternaria burnsii]|uniref:Uncharacterized protein n=1 Tax=Alternaria burnsii TaxID=1187904 RepID=A0A8H7B3F9_9PLEO|nr:uncharacterized protein GT037_007390 [Alternaria burnsii]KAF7674630.1 hypothetical protein GT037_007390 [Alternaria burnsii]CAI9625064.1 unnamed protein product [Alternaria burnsii]
MWYLVQTPEKRSVVSRDFAAIRASSDARKAEEEALRLQNQEDQAQEARMQKERQAQADKVREEDRKARELRIAEKARKKAKNKSSIPAPTVTPSKPSASKLPQNVPAMSSAPSVASRPGGVKSRAGGKLAPLYKPSPDQQSVLASPLAVSPQVPVGSKPSAPSESELEIFERLSKKFGAQSSFSVLPSTLAANDERSPETPGLSAPVAPAEGSPESPKLSASTALRKTCQQSHHVQNSFIIW